MSIRMEWIDEQGNLQMREEQCERDLASPRIAETLLRMYETHLKDLGYTKAEELRGVTGVVSVRGQPKQYLQDLLSGE
jgi:hypothetical protein